MIKDIILEHNKNVFDFCVEHDLDASHFEEIRPEAHPVCQSAARKFRILAEPMVDFISDLSRAFKGLPMEAREYLTTKASAGSSLQNFTYRIEDNLHIPFPMVWSKDKRLVVCFKNLPCPVIQMMSQVRAGFLHNVHEEGYNRKEVLTSLKEEDALLPRFSNSIVSSIYCDLDNEHKQKAWTPLSRGIRRLADRREFSIERAISRFIKWNGQFICDLDRGSWIIEIIADTMRAYGEPPTIVKCSSLADYEAMYTYTEGESPGSCMDSTHKFNELKRSDGTRNGRPVDWYHYCPIVTGYYMCRGNVVLARTFVYEYEGRKVYTRVYGSVQAHKLKLIDHLKKEGVVVYKNATDTLDNPIKFNIPWYSSGGDDCIPMPYFDWTPFTRIYCKPSRDGVTVHLVGIKALDREITQKCGGANITSTRGIWYSEDRYDDDHPYCTHCEEELDDYLDAGGYPFCNSDCVSDHGWWTTINMSSENRYEPETRWVDGSSRNDQSPDVLSNFRPAGERAFVPQYSFECGIETFAKSKPALMSHRWGYATPYVAFSQGILLSRYSCAISEDIHFVANNGAIKRQHETCLMSYVCPSGKKGSEIAIAKWGTHQSQYDNVDWPSFATLHDYRLPCNDNERCKKFHINPIRIPIDEWQEQVDTSKPYPLLTKRALFSLTNPTINVEAMIDSHVAEVKHIVNFNNCNCTNYLNPIISKEDI